MFGAVINFYSHPVFVVFGGICATLVLIGFLINILFFVLGISPLLWRLGFGRWTRKIAIVASGSFYGNLKKDLVDSGIFRKNNVSPITEKFLSGVKDHSLLLVHYQSFNKDQIYEILSNKKSGAGMIIYFPEYSPPEGKQIPIDMLKRINDKENTTVVNMRGRLLNDVVTSLITTSYEKK